MPTIFSHAAFVLISGQSLARGHGRLFAIAAFCSIVPDFDIIAFAFRVPYSAMFGHRGATHSIAFAIIFGSIVAAVCRRLIGTELDFIRLWALFTVSTLTHPLLDMLTNGGLGVALFAPFSNQRFFLPFRPVEVSPIGPDFFSAEGLQVITSEFLWIWLPAIFVMLGIRLIKVRR